MSIQRPMPSRPGSGNAISGGNPILNKFDNALQTVGDGIVGAGTYLYNLFNPSSSANSNTDAAVQSQFNNGQSWVQEMTRSESEQLDRNMAFNAEQARIAREFNAREAQKLRDWQKHMSDTSYQRAMQDMMKAGLNPILAFQQGGASTPTGSSASSNNASMSTGGGMSIGDLISFLSIVAQGFSSSKHLRQSGELGALSSLVNLIDSIIPF